MNQRSRRRGARRWKPARIWGTWAAVWVLAGLAGVGAAHPVGQVHTFEATMRGVGRAVGGIEVAYHFALWCEPDNRTNHLRVRWGKSDEFTLEQVTDALCVDRRVSEPRRRQANFDTHRGEGVGSLNGVEGARVAWTFTDAGQADRPDETALTITDASGRPVLRIEGAVTGHHRALGETILPVTPRVDPEHLVHSVVIDPVGRVEEYTVTQLPATAFTLEPRDPGPKPDAGAETPPPKIHPELEKILAALDPDARVVIVVNLRDDLTVPRFPDLPRGVDRDSAEAAPGFAAQAAIIEALRERRAQSTEGFLRGLAAPRPPVGAGSGLDVQRLRHFWLVNGFVADARAGDVRALAAHPDVLHVEPELLRSPEIPPHHDGPPDFPPHADAAAGRAVMGSDAYANLAGMRRGYIGLIDTGFAIHALLLRLGTIEGDCVDGGADCRHTGNTGYDTVDCWNHGTSSAAIVNGTSFLGDAVRGVTDIIADRWKVWLKGSPACGGAGDGIPVEAVERAFEVGLSVGDRVFAAVIQPEGPETGTVAVAADNAFDAGAVVLAANGNCAVDPECRARAGSPGFGTVRTPANAHKVLGVGDFNVVDLDTRPYQGRGPTSDGRVKPDIQAPTDVRTASSASPTALKERFGGTSASTPFAAGAAALMRNWLRKFNTFDPGATYARLILSGDAVWTPFGYSNLFGAGHLRLPALCGVTARWGKVTFSATSRERTPVVSVPIDVVGSGRSLAVALWWPESVREAHDDIDVHVLDPNGVERASARSALSVFERTEVAGPVMPGTWTLEIRGTDVNSPPQTVYWTADVRRLCFGTAPRP